MKTGDFEKWIDRVCWERTRGVSEWRLVGSRPGPEVILGEAWDTGVGGRWEWKVNRGLDGNISAIAEAEGWAYAAMMAHALLWLWIGKLDGWSVRGSWEGGELEVWRPGPEGDGSKSAVVVINPYEGRKWGVAERGVQHVALHKTRPEALFDLVDRAMMLADEACLVPVRGGDGIVEPRDEAVLDIDLLERCRFEVERLG